MRRAISITEWSEGKIGNQLIVSLQLPAVEIFRRPLDEFIIPQTQLAWLSASPTMVLTVHHLDNSRSQRILWLLVRFAPRISLSVLHSLESDSLNIGRAPSPVRGQTVPERYWLPCSGGTQRCPLCGYISGPNGGRFRPRRKRGHRW